MLTFKSTNWIKHNLRVELGANLYEPCYIKEILCIHLLECIADTLNHLRVEFKFSLFNFTEYASHSRKSNYTIFSTLNSKLSRFYITI